MDDTFNGLVDKLDDIADDHGGKVRDDDRRKYATYTRDGVTFTFDLTKRRLEISFGESGTLALVDAVRQFQLGNSKPSPMLLAGSNPRGADVPPGRRRGRE